MYFYEFQAGTAYFSRFGLDDRTARKLLARWLRLFWSKYQEKAPAGSIARAIDNGWYAPTEASIRRRWCGDSTVVPCIRPAVIESFEISPESISELSRVWDR